jgi:magnesium-transporting ATPase (P-type)
MGLKELRSQSKRICFVLNKMSLVVIVGVLILAIILLVVNLIYISLALYSLGIENIFRTLEEFLEGKNKESAEAEEYLFFASEVSGAMLAILIVVVILLIVAAVFLAPEEGIAAIGLGGAEAVGAAGAEVGAEAVGAEAGGSLFSSGFRFVGGFIDDILIFVVIIIVFASIASGILCSLAANSIRNSSSYRKGKSGYRTAFNYAVIAAIAGFGVIGVVILGTIALYIFRYWEKREAQQRLQTEIRGFLTEQRLEQQQRVPPAPIVEQPRPTATLIAAPSRIPRQERAIGREEAVATRRVPPRPESKAGPMTEREAPPRTTTTSSGRRLRRTTRA